MKVLQINTVYKYGSTGKIVGDLQALCHANGIECVCAHRYDEGKGGSDTLSVSSWLDCHVHNRLSRYTALQGCFSRIKTAAFLRKVRRLSPDVIHLHNLHGSYINLPLLFSFLKKRDIPVIWTLHDCWAFTGGCPHFTMDHCDQWRNVCCPCPRSVELPLPFRRDRKWMLSKKKDWFTGITNMTLVTPSVWLSQLVAQSFLREYPSVVIPNGVDLDIFKPTPSDFREKHHIPAEKKILLGVAFGWGPRKGLDVFVSLAERLAHEQYQIVLVGTDERIDAQLPSSIISIHRTNNQQELAAIYTAADLFVNPTREEMFGLVNVEANACGTPVLTFRTGGCPECIDETSGSIVPCDDIASLEAEIIRICETIPFSAENCIRKAQTFNKFEKYEEYLKLYETH